MVRSQKGFTIIELVVVIVILGILSAVAFPKFQDMGDEAKKAVVNGGAAAIKSGAVIYFAKNQGTKLALAQVNSTAVVQLDSNISVSKATCATIKVGYNGLFSVNVDLSDYCQ
jgi:MSHA pilin protein MshA